jgi:hypothetical protein
VPELGEPPVTVLEPAEARATDRTAARTESTPVRSAAPIDAIHPAPERSS